METLDLKQGTPEWHAHRRNHFNASDAPAMLSCSPYKTRDQLLQEMKTGIAPEVDANTQFLYDRGHDAEAKARPLAEEIIGDELYPVTGTLGKLSASFDGLTLVGDTAFEHKLLNDELRTIMSAKLGASGTDLPLHYQVQMEQQCMVSECSRVLFMATRWKGDECVEQYHCWYYSNTDLRRKILIGWQQFEADLQTFVPTEVAVKPTGKAPLQLPALLVQLKGEVTASNLGEFRDAAITVFESVSRDLKTDEDFANAEATVKWCNDVEQRLATTKEHALAQTASIYALFRTIDEISASARQLRLDLDKLVKSKKDSIRVEIMSEMTHAYTIHLASLNKRLGGNYMPVVPADFVGAMKGKKTVASLRSAANDELARAKIASSEIADRIDANLKLLTGEAHDWKFLFPDLSAVLSKPTEDFANLITSRIKAHEDAVEARRKAEVERVAAEKKAAEDREAQAKLRAMEAAATTTVVTPVTSDASEPPVRPVNEKPTLKLGDISSRLGFVVTSDFLTALGYAPAATERASKLYHADQFPAICRAIANHVTKVGSA